jgi:hypothetical protein
MNLCFLVSIAIVPARLHPVPALLLHVLVSCAELSCFTTSRFAGRLASGPVLAITSDQASTMFAAASHLAFHCSLRVVWFPDINHVEHNTEKGVLSASGLGQVGEKVTFLARLPRGPVSDAGHWHAQMVEAFQVIFCAGVACLHDFARCRHFELIIAIRIKFHECVNRRVHLRHDCSQLRLCLRSLFQSVLMSVALTSIDHAAPRDGLHRPEVASIPFVFAST